MSGQNQVTGVGASSITFDSNGSLTSDGTTGKSYTYDAWNRLVKVQSGGSTIAVHEYDGLGRQAQSGTTSPTDERWFSLRWQVLETRPSDNKTTQQVWSPVYVDALVARDRDTDANGSLDERVYALQDANFDVTALVNTSGTVIERFTYDRYGTFAVLDANWAADADGLSDVAWGNFFQGLAFDAAAGGSVARWRIVLHYLGRPLQADPLGYPDGMSRYEWEMSRPTSALDPFGLQATGGSGSGYEETIRKGQEEVTRNAEREREKREEELHLRITIMGDLDDYRGRDAMEAALWEDIRSGRLRREFENLDPFLFEGEALLRALSLQRMLKELLEVERVARLEARARAVAEAARQRNMREELARLQPALRAWEDAAALASLWQTVYRDQVAELTRRAAEERDADLAAQLLQQVEQSEEALERERVRQLFQEQRIRELQRNIRGLQQGLQQPSTQPTN